jgi:hypothetical protein
LSESRYLTARSLTFFDDGTDAKLSIVTVEGGHLYIKVSPTQTALLNAELATFNFKQHSKMAKATKAD